MRAGVDELLHLFVRLAGIASPSGEERPVADAVIQFVEGVGLSVAEDSGPGHGKATSGNLIVRVPGRGSGTPIMLCAHLDTVPVDHAPTVIVDNGVVRSDGATVLGADDKAAVAVLLSLLGDLAAEPPQAGVEVVFTVAEEVGLQGAGAVDLDGLDARVAYVFDSEGVPGTVIASAPWLKAIDAEFRGVAAHAGIEPEKGRSAIVAAARAVAAMRLGRIDDETTANVGIVAGGSAMNIVPERCRVTAEARSRDAAKVAAQTEDMVQALHLAAAECGVDVSVDVKRAFDGYAHDPDGLPLRLAVAAVAEAGLEPRLIGGGGGSDANVFNAKGLPAVTMGVGFERVHSPEESIRVDRLAQLYRLAHALVRAAGAAA